MEKVNWGIIGFGQHAKDVMAPAFADANAGLLAMIGTSSSKIKSISENYKNVFCSANYEDVISNENLQAVYIGLPNHLHAEWTIKALNNKKHVLCDKPLGISSEEVKNILFSAKANEMFVLEGFMYRFHPQHQEVKRLLNEGIIGELRVIGAHFHYHLTNLNNIRLRREYYGGALMDVGCYLLDLVQFLTTTRPKILSAASYTGEESQVDETTVIHAELPNKVSAHLVSGTRLLRKNFYTLYGTKGMIHVPDAFRIPRNKQGSIEIETIDAPKKVIHIPACNQYAKEIDVFSSLILGQVVDTSIFPNSLTNAELIEEVRNQQF